MKYLELFENWEQPPHNLEKLGKQMKGRWWKWGKVEWLFVPEGKNPPEEALSFLTADKKHPWFPLVVWISNLERSWSSPGDPLSPFYRGTGYRINYYLPGHFSGNTHWIRETDNVPIFLELLKINEDGKISDRVIGWFFDQVRKDLPGSSMEKLKSDFIKSDIPATANDLIALGMDPNKYRGALSRKKFGF